MAATAKSSKTTKSTAAIKAKKTTTRKKVAAAPEAQSFNAGDLVVYPAHGIGHIEGIETLDIAGQSIQMYNIMFKKDRMKLKLPVNKIQTAGLRALSSDNDLKKAMQTMRGRARVRRAMWSRRAQEYEAKINSGDPLQIAEVLRDLRRNVSNNEHSYSERQIYQSALERLASELAAVEKIDQDKATTKLEDVLKEVA